jgi:hypothetical protein
MSTTKNQEEKADHHHKPSLFVEVLTCTHMRDRSVYLWVVLLFVCAMLVNARSASVCAFIRPGRFHHLNRATTTMAAEKLDKNTPEAKWKELLTAQEVIAFMHFNAFIFSSGGCAGGCLLVIRIVCGPVC